MEQDICGCYRPAPSAAPPSPLREAACDEEALLDLPACEWMIRDRNGTSLISMGNHLLSGPSVAEMHTHHALEISCVPSGSGTYHVDDRFYPIEPGDVFILNNTESHGLILGEGQRINNQVIHFDPSFICEIPGQRYGLQFPADLF